MSSIDLTSINTEEELKNYIVNNPQKFAGYTGLIKNDGGLSGSAQGRSAYNKVADLWRNQKSVDTSASQSMSSVALQSKIGGNMQNLDSSNLIGKDPF